MLNIALDIVYMLHVLTNNLVEIHSINNFVPIVSNHGQFGLKWEIEFGSMEHAIVIEFWEMYIGMCN